MQVIAFRDLEREIEARRKELGISDADVVPVNSGRYRTAQKRALLRSIQEISAKKGTPPKFKANF